ncbi:hypothetical protein LU373_004798 [Salmonella enterica]|nr:hypothetical protein [Salmonella enterica]EIQ4098590.1 hypothetical protein [Salmonella enterica]EIQ4170568.1 hypothetical protein [Salmonella enterica]
MKTENMTTIRRYLWQQEERERAEVLALWEADYQDNKPKKADVNHTQKQGEASHHAVGV